MIRLAITQRVDVIESYGERRDSLDQNWTRFFGEAGDFLLVPVPNTLNVPLVWISDMSIDGFVLTGGNDLSFVSSSEKASSERDRTEKVLLSRAQEKGLPVLGVCRGMQMINHFLGGRISRLDQHVACRHNIEKCGQTVFLGNYKSVNSFHNYGIQQDDLADDLNAVYQSDDGYIEAFEHKTLPWVGMMWHPEREAGFSQDDIRTVHNLFERKSSGDVRK